MKNKTLINQIKKLNKFIPKHIVIIPEIKDRELTEDEFIVIKEYLKFYYSYYGSDINWIPVNGMIIKYFSKKSYIDFAFMNQGYKDGEFHIYLNLK